ncbi:cell envelope integrity protein TolA [Galbibacter sp.]|uniref:cell envelope integrity protein TolA n=1 Tax=Galbibacter sp. TaxID=2918471 RepID=UPI002B807966|nr:cell envelope integrity protein TolA [Galbibacter sp.]HLV64103.1 cell envelope integrity protein TolA [Galbibacter sp.]
MSLLDTTHKRKSFTLTTALLTALLLLFFYIGLSYLDPPIESGITINFGTTEFGSGNVQPNEPIKSQPQHQPEPVEETTPIIEKSQPEEATSTPAEEVKTEEVVIQDNEESLVIQQQKEAEAKRKAEAAAQAKRQAEEEAKRKAEAEAEARRQAEAERIRKEQEAKRQNLDALMGGLNSSEGTATGNDGDDNRAGDKGQIDGDPYANSYYGSAGSGTGGTGYGLSGRSLRASDKFVQQCNEQGTVVVEIEVDRSGNVVKTSPGVKGTTNTAKCLLDAAAKTAQSYKWNADPKAPVRQIGFVVVNFKLGE